MNQFGGLAGPEFDAYLNQLRLHALEAARTEIQHLTNAAASTLCDIMKNSESDMARLKAATMMLHHCGLTDPNTGLFGWGIGRIKA